MDHPSFFFFFQVLIKNHYANIHRHCWRESLKICKFTKFKGQASKASIHILGPQSRETVKTFVSQGGPGVGSNLLPPSPSKKKIETFQTFSEFAKLPYICVSFQQIIFKLGNFTDNKAFFPALLPGFFLTGSQSKDREARGPHMKKTIHTTKEQLADFYFNPFIFVGFVACVAAGPRTRLNHL